MPNRGVAIVLFPYPLDVARLAPGEQRSRGLQRAQKAFAALLDHAAPIPLRSLEQLRPAPHEAISQPFELLKINRQDWFAVIGARGGDEQIEMGKLRFLGKESLQGQDCRRPKQMPDGNPTQRRCPQALLAWLLLALFFILNQHPGAQHVIDRVAQERAPSLQGRQRRIKNPFKLDRRAREAGLDFD